MMRIAVIGAGGFVGGWICEQLTERTDIDVVALVRKWASAVRLARRGIDIRQADLEYPDQLQPLLSGADVVINASMPLPSREADLVAGLFVASARAGVRRFIQFSSAAVYGELTGEIDESMAPAPIDDYSRGKAQMERRLIEVAATHDVPVIILRPSIIYGPFSDAWTVRYVDRVKKGKWRHLGGLGSGICNLVHGQDVARAAIAAATADIPAGAHVLNINGPDVVSWNDYIERLGDALGIPGRSVPKAVLVRAMVYAAEIMRFGARPSLVKAFYRRSTGTAHATMKRAQGATKLYPTSGELRLLMRNVHYAANRAEQLLGLKPTISVDEGVRQSVAWCQVHGVI